MKIIPIILSGGTGNRLWPVSTNKYPKQFLKLFSDKTIFQETLLRIKFSDIKIEKPIISCRTEYKNLVNKQLKQIKTKATLILEPLLKNTAPAIAVSCFEALKRNNDSIVTVFPSDHIIKNKKIFCNKMKLALQQAQKGNIVTFGIKPMNPATCYGYIKTKNNNKTVLDIEQFIEKPSIEKAINYLKNKNFYWNSGIYVFKPTTFLQELEKFEPEIYKYSKLSFDKSKRANNIILLNKQYFNKIKQKAVDYAVMEKTKKIKLIKFNVGWKDIGSYDSIYKLSKKDKNKNVIYGNIKTADTKSSYIYSETKPIFVIGAKNLIIVETKNGILVSVKEKIDKIKNLIKD